MGINTGIYRGIFQLVIAGINQGDPQDEYSSTSGFEVRDLGIVTFSSAGVQDFQFVVTDHNVSGVSYALAFDYRSGFSPMSAKGS